MLATFGGEPEDLRQLRIDAEKAEIPPIAIAPEQGPVLATLVRAARANRILEIGTLAGYSAIVMARALGSNGHLDTLEVDPFHAEFARERIAMAGLSDRVTVYTGDALDLLERTIDPDEPYDILFIDADKPNYRRYVELALPMIRPGGMIIGDNALAWGEVDDAGTDREDVMGIRAFNAFMAEHPQIDACIVPSGDGMCIGVVSGE